MNSLLLFACVITAVLWFWYWLLRKMLKDKVIAVVVALGASIITVPLLYLALIFIMTDSSRPLK